MTSPLTRRVYPCLHASLLALLCSLALAVSVRAGVGDIGPWGDQGNGTYQNPILPLDYSDPDPIRVGSDYYLVSSTFQFSPGVVVLHSKDLVNWQTIGYAFSDVTVLGPKYNWDKMAEYNEGVYAPSIRYHDGKFWVFVDCLREGFWMSTATDPAGPWTPRQLVDKNGLPLRTSGWTDVCPLWDDDGKAYLAAAGQHCLWLFQMKPDGTQLLDADIKNPVGLGGTRMWNYPNTEGNKLYKWHGIYYLFNVDFLGHGPLGIGCYLKRSKNLYGTKPDGSPGRPGDPGTYEYIRLSDVSLPTQGGFVDTPEGKWYFLGQFNHINAGGRYPYLLPATWLDGWLRPGADIGPDVTKFGRMVWSAPKPVSGFPIVAPQGSDEFNRPVLDPQWQWNYQPRAGYWSLTARPGWLRLKAYRPIPPGGFFKAGNTLLQRYYKADTVRAEVKIDLSAMTDGEAAGLAHFNGGRNYFTIGAVQQGTARTLEFNNNGKVTTGPAVGGTIVYFRTDVNAANLATFSYSFDGQSFSSLGEAFKLVHGGYRGDCIGIYNYNNAADSGWIDVDWFHYTYAGPTLSAQ
jgi:beta-xylosidase